MDDMSAEGVKALLAFIYFGDLAKPSVDYLVALELLQAGEKYMIKNLRRKMINILLLSNFHGWSVDFAIKLWLFAKKR